MISRNPGWEKLKQLNIKNARGTRPKNCKTSDAWVCRICDTWNTLEAQEHLRHEASEAQEHIGCESRKAWEYVGQATCVNL